MASIALKNLDKPFGREDGPGLKIDLEVADGEFFVVLGASRSGKSTLLRLIAGLEWPRSGRVEIDGADVTGMPPKDRDVGMFFQNYALYPNRTGRENIGAGLRNRGLSASEIKDRVDAVAETLGVAHLLDRKPSTYSGGEQQRVAIGRVIARPAAVYLFDEPLSNLDAAVRARLREEFKRLQRDLGVTTVYVTPDQLEAMALADRIAVLDQGEIVQVGTPRELYDRPRNSFVAGFLGTPPMNLIDGPLGLDPGGGHAGEALLSLGGESALEIEDLHLPSLGDTGLDGHTVGVRPEKLKPGPGRGFQVVAVEVLGRQQLVHLEAGRHLLKAVVGADPELVEGTEVGLRCAGRDLYLFDAGDGRLLPTQSAAGEVG